MTQKAKFVRIAIIIFIMLIMVGCTASVDGLTGEYAGNGFVADVPVIMGVLEETAAPPPVETEPETAAPPPVETEPETAAPPPVETEPETATPPPVETEPETAAPPPVETEPETAAPPPVETEPEIQASSPAENSGTMVWIPTKGGKKYHAHSTCSKMVDPSYVTLTEAQSLGFTACKRCYK